MFYSGGGGGGGGSGGGTGGSSVGGNGGLSAGNNGVLYSGGGGGGSQNGGGTGGSGIVILRYPSANSVTVGAGLSTGVLNGTVSGGTDKYTTFTLGSGTITFS